MTVETTRFATRALHSARARETAPSRATPIYLTAGFEFANFEHAADHFDTGAGFGYTRTGNPTVQAVERQLAALERGADAVLVASGQAAVATALVSVAGAGDHIVSSTHIYEGTRGLLVENLARFGIETTFVDDIDNPEAWRAAVRPNTRAFFAESLANARNDVIDVAAISALADEFAVPLIVDNTLATPVLLRPLEHGAAMVVHSASKFLAGHGSVLGGVIVGDTLARVAYARESVVPRFGASPSPLNAFLIGQGVETLKLRVERQSQTALQLARWLSTHDAVESVDYVGLAMHPSHERAARSFDVGFGSVFTFTLRGGLPAARHFVEHVGVFTHMTHIGDVRSLVLHPASTSHTQRTAAERHTLGVHPGTLRVSIGIEDIADLIADLDRALEGSRELIA